MFRFSIRDMLWLMVVVGLSTALLIQSAALRRANVAMNDAYQRADILSSWMRQDGYEVDAPLGGRGPIRIPSPKQIIEERATGRIVRPNSK